MIKLNYPKFWNQKTPISFLLLPFSLVYKIFGIIRKVCIKEQKLCAPVICVGNATVGGTGKTPIIKALAADFASGQKKKVLIITKGYGGNYANPSIVEPNFTTCFAGDEAIELVESLYKLGDITVIVSRNPVFATKLIDQIKPDIIFVDDGMQNPSFYKDFVILMIDGMRGFANEMLLPAGPLRQDVSQAAAACDIAISTNPSSSIDIKLKNLIKHKYIAIDQNFNEMNLGGQNVYLVCAIGNPERFFTSFIQKIECNIVGRLTFPDHHNYIEKDVEVISQNAKSLGASKIIITEKDYVKLKHFEFDLEIEVAKITYSKDAIKQIVSIINEKISL